MENDGLTDEILEEKDKKEKELMNKRIEDSDTAYTELMMLIRSKSEQYRQCQVQMDSNRQVS